MRMRRWCKKSDFQFLTLIYLTAKFHFQTLSNVWIRSDEGGGGVREQLEHALMAPCYREKIGLTRSSEMPQGATPSHVGEERSAPRMTSPVRINPAKVLRGSRPESSWEGQLSWDMQR